MTTSSQALQVLSQFQTTAVETCFHDRHIGPQILAGLNGKNWSLQDYVARGMSAYVEKVQEPEFAARDRGYSFVSHQQEVGTGYFDLVATIISGGKASTLALKESTEAHQF